MKKNTAFCFTKIGTRIRKNESPKYFSDKKKKNHIFEGGDFIVHFLKIGKPKWWVALEREIATSEYVLVRFQHFTSYHEKELSKIHSARSLFGKMQFGRHRELTHKKTKHLSEIIPFYCFGSPKSSLTSGKSAVAAFLLSCNCGLVWVPRLTLVSSFKQNKHSQGSAVNVLVFK